jgi:cytochrome c peroxidase
MLGAAGCGTPAQQGDCGPYLTSGQCQVVRTQLGALDARPPPDPSNRFGRCVRDFSSECIEEDAAAQLGQRLFYDRCLSTNNDTACVTCHQPSQAFTDNRIRALTIPVMENGGTVHLPPIKNASTILSKTPPPAVEPMVDDDNNPLARWNPDTMHWEGMLRRPISSLGSANVNGTSRHAPGLYNLAYGGGFPTPNNERAYGVTWVPWDGRYDSVWSMVADVWEFGATHNTDRAHIAVRIGQKHRQWYEAMIGGPLYDFDEKKLSGGVMKYVYPRHGSPTGNPCWYSGKDSDCTTQNWTSMVPTDQVRANVNEVFVNAGKALAAYVRRLRSANAPYDRWLAGDQNAMSPPAQRGLGLFVGKAECVLCHNGPNFTDFRFHNLGVPSKDIEQRIAGSAVPQPPNDGGACFDGLGPTPVCPDPGRQAWQLRAAGQCPTDAAAIGGKNVTCQRVDQPDSLNKYDVAMDCRSAASDATDKDAECLASSMADPQKCAYTDGGSCQADPLCQWLDMGLPSIAPRCVARALPAELGQFKTASLRNVALTFPYMHNGLLSDYGPADRGKTTIDDPVPHLTKVVSFYNNGGGTPDVGTLDPLIHPLHLTASEIADLVEFLQALTDNSMYTSGDPLAMPPAGLGPNDPVDDCPDPPPYH